MRILTPGGRSRKGTPAPASPPPHIFSRGGCALTGSQALRAAGSGRSFLSVPFGLPL
nr:MAG TPA: hypothetical protein [Caudoviricetes sp.]